MPKQASKAITPPDRLENGMLRAKAAIFSACICCSSAMARLAIPTNPQLSDATAEGILSDKP